MSTRKPQCSSRAGSVLRLTQFVFRKGDPLGARFLGIIFVNRKDCIEYAAFATIFTFIVFPILPRIDCPQTVKKSY